MILPALYHWSPADRFDSIRTGGLVPGSPSTVASSRLPHVCFGFTPSGAWALSGSCDWASEVDEWDLWQFRAVEGDDIRIRPDFGPVLREVKVYGSVPPDRLWHVGRRPRDGMAV